MVFRKISFKSGDNRIVNLVCRFNNAEKNCLADLWPLRSDNSVSEVLRKVRFTKYFKRQKSLSEFLKGFSVVRDTDPTGFDSFLIGC